MSKIRIPRKKKKHIMVNMYSFPYVPKIERYKAYFSIEYGIKRFNMTPEKLCDTFGVYIMDHVIWWNWVRYKKLGIKPELSEKYLEYWNFFKNKGIIK